MNRTSARPTNSNLRRSCRFAFVERPYRNVYLLTANNSPGPFVFQFSIFTAVKTGVLGKVIERFSRAIEARSYEMTAVVARSPVGSTRLALDTSRADGVIRDMEFTGHFMRAPLRIDGETVVVANDGLSDLRKSGAIGLAFNRSRLWRSKRFGVGSWLWFLGTLPRTGGAAAIPLSTGAATTESSASKPSLPGAIQDTLTGPRELPVLGIVPLIELRFDIDEQIGRF